MVKQENFSKTEPPARIALPTISSWADWGAIFTDTTVWAPAVQEICRRAGRLCHTIEPGYPGTNAVFIVNRPPEESTRHTDDRGAPFVVKIYAPFCPEDFALERKLYPLLQHVGVAGTPELLGAGVLEEALPSNVTWPYLILSYLPGDPIREVRDYLTRADMEAIARDLGRRIRTLHATPLARLRIFDTSQESWARYVQRRLGDIEDELTHQTSLPPDVVRAVPAYVQATLNENPPAGLVLVNGDLTEDHVLLTQENEAWAISGLIDFADTLVAPRHYEWIALWFGALNCDTAGFKAFMTAYEPDLQLDAAFYRRAMAFTFLHEFGALIIATALKQTDVSQIATLDDLQRILWHPASS